MASNAEDFCVRVSIARFQLTPGLSRACVTARKRQIVASINYRKGFFSSEVPRSRMAGTDSRAIEETVHFCSRHAERPEFEETYRRRISGCNNAARECGRSSDDGSFKAEEVAAATSLFKLVC